MSGYVAVLVKGRRILTGFGFEYRCLVLKADGSTQWEWVSEFRMPF